MAASNLLAIDRWWTDRLLALGPSGTASQIGDMGDVGVQPESATFEPV